MAAAAAAGAGGPVDVLQKLKIEPPTKFTGREDFERWFKRTTNYLCLSDENYRTVFGSMQNHPKTIIDPAVHYAQIDQTLGVAAGTAAKMSRALYYILDGLLDDAYPPYTLHDSTLDNNGFEVIRKLLDRYMKSKQMKSILLLVKIVTTRFDDKSFENSFAYWESDITKFELAIGKRAVR